MKTAWKYVNGPGTSSQWVNYQYCLSCDGALSKRLEYNSSGQLTSEKRYEYDGLNLLRVDERCDADGDGIVEAGETTWRMVEVATHRPGQLGALVGKRVYSYPTAGNRCVSNGYTVYTFGYDAVGNVAVVFTGGGDEAFFFAQDAFGNELDIAAFASSDWVDARDDGVGEHQTGKWVDPFTGQYYFHARWYDSVVGRFTGRDPVNWQSEHYLFVANSPTTFIDPAGQCGVKVHRIYFMRIDGDWGHEWMEGCGITAGFWPNRHDPDYDKKAGVCGAGGYIESPDPHADDRPSKTWDTKKRHSGRLKFGPEGVKGKCCKEATCSDVCACLREVFTPGEADVTYRLLGSNCRTFMADALEACCLKKKRFELPHCEFTGAGFRCYF